MLKLLFTIFCFTFSSLLFATALPATKQPLRLLPEHTIDAKYLMGYLTIRVLGADGRLLQGNYSYTFTNKKTRKTHESRNAACNFKVEQNTKYVFEVVINELDSDGKILRSNTESKSVTTPVIADLNRANDSLNYVIAIRRDSILMVVTHGNNCSPDNAVTINKDRHLGEYSDVTFGNGRKKSVIEDNNNDNDGAAPPKIDSLLTPKKRADKANIYTFSNHCNIDEVNALAALFSGTASHYDTDKSWFKTVDDSSGTNVIPLMRLYYSCEKSVWSLNTEITAKLAEVSDIRPVKYKIILVDANNNLRAKIQIKPETIELLQRALEKPIESGNVKITVKTNDTSENRSFSSILTNYIETNYDYLKQNKFSFKEICLQVKTLGLLDITVEKQ